MKAKGRLLILALIAGAALLAVVGFPPGPVTFSQFTDELDAYDVIELTAQVSAPRAMNPFQDATIRGTFQRASGDDRWQIEGFCDSDDGSVYRIRFMPPAPGNYTYALEYRQGWSTRTATGTFHVKDGHRRGTVRVDPKHRWHFIWEGTGEHYFFNGTTAPSPS